MLSLAKQLRLKTKRDFKLTLDAGHKTVSINLVIIARPNETGPRLGLIVSRKVGNAVMRNRVKRLIRECFRTQQHELDNSDYVIIARPKANTAEMKHINRDFRYCMKRLGQRSAQTVTKDTTTCSVQQYA